MKVNSMQATQFLLLEILQLSCNSHLIVTFLFLQRMDLAIQTALIVHVCLMSYSYYLFTVYSKTWCILSYLLCTHVYDFRIPILSNINVQLKVLYSLGMRICCSNLAPTGLQYDPCGSDVLVKFTCEFFIPTICYHSGMQ